MLLSQRESVYHKKSPKVRPGVRLYLTQNTATPQRCRGDSEFDIDCELKQAELLPLVKSH